MKQIREIDAKLQEIVPKIAEINTICREVNRETVLYEPEIVTDVKTDGSKVSSVVVRVYPDRTNREESSLIPWETFTDKVYFDVKELYEEYEEKNFDQSTINDENDGEIFGYALAESWIKIGDVFIFLVSMLNLCETPKDESPIIDSKGIKQGAQNYAVFLELFEKDKKTKIDLIEYDTLSQLEGRWLKMTIEIKRASDIPDKYAFKTKACYNWLDQAETLFETKEVNNTKNPDFQYRQEHMIEITKSLCDTMHNNTLKIQVFGMIEAKKIVKKNDENDYSDEEQQIEIEEAKGESSSAMIRKETVSVNNMQSAMERIKQLEK